MYKSDVATLFKLSSKSEITTESKFKPPKVYLCSSFLIFFSLLISFSTKASEKIQIGLMVPLTGPNKELGQSIIKAVRLAVKDINNNSIEIIPKDTASKANKALKSAFELQQMGVRIVIGPIFYESITYLDEIKDITFLSLTNKTLDLPKNVISAGINSTSQMNTIKKFIRDK